MRLYLIRHAEAKDNGPDAQRKLTGRGRREAKRLARHLRKLKLRVAAVWHSGLPRAEQTAKPIAKAVKSRRRLRARAGMQPEAGLRQILKDVDAARGDLMLVGHEPFLGRLAARLVVGKEDVPLLNLAKPSVICLERDKAGAWHIAWMLAPETY